MLSLINYSKVIIFLCFFSISNLYANHDQQYKFCNHHKFTFLLTKIYDIYLCVDNENNLNYEELYQHSFILRINYNKGFSKEKLAKSSLNEMNKYAEITSTEQKSYYQQLIDIFPDIYKNDNLEVFYQNKNSLSFYYNHQYIAIIDDKKFIRRFLNIWLHKDNKYPKMHKNLFSSNEQ